MKCPNCGKEMFHSVWHLKRIVERGSVLELQEVFEKVKP